MFSSFLPLTRPPGYCRFIRRHQPFYDTYFRCYLRQTRRLQPATVGKVLSVGPSHTYLREASDVPDAN